MAKSARNKTIDFSLEENSTFLERCIVADDNRELGLNKILDKTILGDILTACKKMPREFVDLLIVDPPYNLEKNFHGNKFSKQSEEQYISYTKEWIEEILPILKPNASIYVCCDWKSSLLIGNVLKDYFCIQNRITWQREKGRGAKSNWKNGMEDIWFATCGKTYYFDVDAVKLRKKVIAPYKVNGKPKDWEETEQGNFRNTCPSNFWDDISIPYWSMPENTAHPTQKPEKLIAKLILASSKQGDIVFDPFLGSGTTSVTAKKLRRHFIGIEHNPLYCSWAEYRLDMANNNSEIQGFSGGVFWERNSLGAQKKEKQRV